jgi:bla regulator protein blaR1
MTAVLQHPDVQALAWALVHFLWQGAALGLAAFLVIRLTRCGAEARYAIGVATLGLMLAMPVVTTAWLAGRTVVTPAPASAIALAGTDGFAPSAAARRSAETSVTAPRAVDPAGPAVPESARRAQTSVLPSVVLGLWLVGVAILSLRLAGGWVVARRLVWRSVRPASAEVQALARRVAGRLALDRLVRVVESSAVAVPMMIGWMKPVVLLPASALSGLTPIQLEALLAHELAHIRRHDYLVNLLQSAVETLLFYHPAVWWVSRQVRAERENCCDDLAIGVCDRLVYVTALADLAAMAAGPRVALAATDGSLLARVRRILGQPRPDRAPGFAWLLGVAAALIAVVIIPIGLASARVAVAAPAAGATAPASSQAAAGPRGGEATGVASAGTGRAASAGAGVATGATGGVADGVAGDVNAGEAAVEAEGRPAPQGTPLTAEEQARIQAELARVRAEQQAGLASQLLARDEQRQAIARILEKLAAAKQGQADKETIAALQDQLAEVERELNDSNAGLTASAQALNGLKLNLNALDMEQLRAKLGGQDSEMRALAASRQQRMEQLQAEMAAKLAQQKALDTREFDRQLAEGQARLMASQKALAARQDAGTSVSEDTHGTSGNLTWSSNGDRVAVKWTGAFRLSDDDKDIAWVEPGKTVEVSNGSWLNSTRVEIKGLASGGVEHTYYRNDIARSYEPDGLAFLAGMLQKIIRQTGFGAQSRVARFLKQGGVKAVLAEIANLQGDYARRLYYTELFKQAKLSPAEITQVATRASQTITSDYELATLLKAAAKQAGTDESALVAVIDAASTVGSDYERHQTLSAALPDHATVKEAAAALTVAGGIRSDYERASFLIEFARKGGLSPGTESAFFDLVHGIHSSYEQGRVLKTVMAMPGVSTAAMAEARKSAQSMTSDYDRRQVLSASMAGRSVSAKDAADILASAAAIRSENDRATVLIELVRKGGLTDATSSAFFPLVAAMRSSYEQRQVMSAVLAQPTLSDGVLTGLLKTAGSVKGDFDRAEVLIATAKAKKLTPAQRDLYLQAADGIRSDYDQTRALAGLVRAERGVR